ncbi:hypothetical protein EDD18DRAFT_1184955 [Armillaria luteobubalina]|uniref:Uncharacterized protein n=1 Tax=Armillaria luteobubalina TaxID=153913 RepID=A0AA39UTH0_9AGAR|nr:hypothetical protein EDD18DRAFT_1184955 [Armillaria luteobubalina]
MQCAAERGAFNSLDPAKDDHTNMFPLHLCSAILDSFYTLPKDETQNFDSPLVLDFKDALPYFLYKICNNVLGMFSEFSNHSSLSDPSLPQSVKLIVVAIKFLCHRSSLPESTMSHTTICQLLSAMILKLNDADYWPKDPTSQEDTALIMALEDIISACLSPLHNMESDWIDLCHDTIKVYYSLAFEAPSACSLSGLQSIADFMIRCWDQTKDHSYRSDTGCRLFTYLLKKHTPIAFTVFYESQCLLFLGNHTFHKASVSMVSAYITGILAMQQGSNGAMDAESLQQHIDCLYNPQNQFTACSILAMSDIFHDQTAVHKDITALAQLCPQDAAWEECYRKLDDLVQGKDGEFFSKQLKWQKSGESYGYFPLHADHIEAEKEDIRFAIHVLHDFFNGREHTMASPDSLSEWHLIDCIHHFL